MVRRRPAAKLAFAPRLIVGRWPLRWPIFTARAALLGLGLVMLASRASAADPQPYEVVIESTGSSEIDEVVRNSSLLVTLKDTAPVPPFGLIARVTGDLQRVQTVLGSFGYYDPEISATIAGRNIADPDLPAFLDGVPQGMTVDVNVAVGTGPLYRLRRISVEGMVPAIVEEAIMLRPGDPAIAANVEAARGRVLTVLQEDGYALATVAEPVAYADDDADAIDIILRVEAGPRADIGAITFQGLGRANEDFVRESFPVRSGGRYSPSRLEAARRTLLETGVFSSVTVRSADRVSADGRIDLTVDAQERPLRAVNLGGEYSTDLGISLSASWTHRNLFGNAEQLTLSAAGTGLWGNATDDIGYEVSARFTKPYFMRRDQTLEVVLSGVKQDLTAYKQTAESIGGFLKRQFSPQWNGSIGLTVTHDDVSQKGTSQIYQLFAIPIALTYDSTGLSNPLLDPTRGIRASFVVTPTQAFGAQTLTFGILQASGSTYFNLSGNGRSVLALRGLLGAVVGASTFDLPPDQRLYAGGSGTVRGFRYQSIGPLFPDGDPTGGTAVDAASIEIRQRLFGNFGVATFVDAGQASDQGVPFTGTLRIGAGLGLRYYTPIGAVRADVAVPLNRAPGGDTFGLYIGLGQAF